MPAVVTDMPNPAKKKVRVGMILFWSAFAAIIFGVLSVIGAFARSGYFIDFNEDNNVVIYRGRVGGMLWFQPTVDTQTELNSKDLPEDVRREVEMQREFSSSGQAAKYLMLVQVAIVDATSTSTTSTTVAK
jgi:hypothetical protein